VWTFRTRTGDPFLPSSNEQFTLAGSGRMKVDDEIVELKE